MKTMSNHLSQIILAVAAIALVVGIVLTFTTPIGGFFSGVTDKLQGIGTGSIWDLGEYGGSDAPTMLEGQGQTFDQSEPTPLSFRSSAPVDELQEVRVNDEVVDPSNYTVTEGSTIITFTEAFLNSLEPGTYTLAIISESGTAECGFVIIAKTTYGTWVFDEFFDEDYMNSAIPQADWPNYLVFNIAFICDGVQYESMLFSNDTGDDGDSIIYSLSEATDDGYVSDDSFYVGFWGSGFDNDKYRTITFLEEPSAELLALLEANAVREDEDNETEDNETSVITGTWLFNNVVDFDSFANISPVVVTFESNGQTYHNFHQYDMSEIYFGFNEDSSSGNGAWAYSTDGGWQSEAYRTVYFGADGQTVSPEFGRWLAANAKKQDVADDSHSYIGTWVLDSCSVGSSDASIPMNFTHNSDEYVSIQYDMSLGVVFVKANGTKVQIYDDGWCVDARNDDGECIITVTSVPGIKAKAFLDDNGTLQN